MGRLIGEASGQWRVSLARHLGNGAPCGRGFWAMGRLLAKLLGNGAPYWRGVWVRERLTGDACGQWVALLVRLLGNGAPHWRGVWAKGPLAGEVFEQRRTNPCEASGHWGASLARLGKGRQPGEAGQVK
jgi:hypothetical protein